MSCISLDAASISQPLSSPTYVLPVCGLSLSTAAAVMFVLSATPPPPRTETGDTQALIGTFTRGRGSVGVFVCGSCYR